MHCTVERYTCDRCRLTVDSDSHLAPPPGWYGVLRAVNHWTDAFHYCPPCATVLRSALKVLDSASPDDYDSAQRRKGAQ